MTDKVMHIAPGILGCLTAVLIVAGAVLGASWMFTAAWVAIGLIGVASVYWTVRLLRAWGELRWIRRVTARPVRRLDDRFGGWEPK